MLCRQCFIYGVARCIKTTGKLPTRRRDVNWFTPFKDNLNDEEKRDVLIEYVEPPEHYYMCMRYRSHIPYTNGVRSFITAVKGRYGLEEVRSVRRTLFSLEDVSDTTTQYYKYL